MEEFLEKKELVSFSVSLAEFFPEKEKFLTKVVETDRETTKFWTVLPDGTKVHLESISGSIFSCPCKDGVFHGEFNGPDHSFEKRTGSFDNGRAHGAIFCWRRNGLSHFATFVKGKVFEMESSLHDGRSQSFLFSRNKKSGTLHVLHKQREGGRFIVRKIFMIKSSEWESVFPCPFVPFVGEPVYRFKKQVVRKTEHFADRPSKESTKNNKVNMFSVD
nr:hypothetical protein [Marseillevirus cajuinensis]